MPSLRTFAAVLVLAAGGNAGAATIELEDCRISAGPSFPSIKARCANLERPLDPDAPDGESISLRIAVVPALTLDPAPDPVVPLAGGPGQSAIQFYAGYSYAFEPLRRDRDILLVDQRGTGSSAPLTCETVEGVVEDSLSKEETLEIATDCLQQLSYDPAFFTTSIAVRDLEAVREALGYGPLNVYGVSYGSRVAQHYARRFPGSTRTIILDGVVPPTLPLGPDIAIQAQKAIDSIFDRCEADPACADAFPGVRETFHSLQEQLAAEPVEVKLADPVTGELETGRFGNMQLAAAVRLLAYHPNTIALIPLFIHEAGQGNFQPLAAQFVMTTKSLAESLAAGMHNSIMCAEDVLRYGEDDLDRAGLEASYLGPALVDSMQTVCTIWPKGPVDDDLGDNLDTDIPTLLLSGSADPITPPEYASLAAVDLEQAWLLTGKDQGHGQLAIGCMPEIVAGFVNAARLEDGAADCFNESYVMPFFLSFSGPSP